ncbi:MAG: nitroreductase/quinone reductase family protein [Pseudonocardiaceae bacterium]
MAETRNCKRRLVSGFHKYVANPVMRRFAGHLPGLAIVETVGRHSGLPRRTPIGGRIEDGCFWLVSDHGRASHYVRNIEADPHVRVQVRSQWRTGRAHLLPEDDPRRRLRRLPRLNGLLVRGLGTDLLTIRIDLD